MVNILKAAWEKVKGLWNIYGGIAISTIIAWLTNWSKVEMDTWSSYLLLTISCISLLTFFKVVFKKKTNGIPDKLISQQKNVKVLKTALYPEQVGEEIGTAIIYTVKGGQKIVGKFGKFLKWIWGNKFTLISIISNLVVSATAQFIMYSDTLKDFAFFQEHKMIFIIVVTALCVLWLFDNIFCVVTKYGLENLEEIKERTAAKKQEQLNKLTPDQKKSLKKVLKGLLDTEKMLIQKIKEAYDVINTVKKQIGDFEVLQSINYQLSAEQIAEYQGLKQKLIDTEASKNSYLSQKEKLDSDIQRVKAKL